MPKRKLEPPSEAALKAIAKAHKAGIPLSEDEVALIRKSTHFLSFPKLPNNVVSKPGYDGKPRFWSGDKPKGPGSVEVPSLRQAQEMERDFLAEQSKRTRHPPTALAIQARKEISKRGAIEQALRKLELDNRHAPALIAKKLHVSASYVRKVRAQVRRSEGMA